MSRRSRDERGFSMMEVTVTVLILGIISVAMLDFLDRASAITAKADRHAQAEQDIQGALRVVSQNLRGANPFGSACTPTTDTATPQLPAGMANCIQFTVSRNVSGVTSCAKTEFVYALVTQGTTRSLVENRRETTGTTSCTVGTWRLRRVLLTSVTNTASEPLFTYYNANGAPVTFGTPAAPTAAEVANANRSASIKVTLRTQYQSSGQSLRLTSIVSPRNRG